MTDVRQGVTVPPRAIPGTVVALLRLREDAQVRGRPFDPHLAALLQQLREAERANAVPARRRLSDFPVRKPCQYPGVTLMTSTEASARLGVSTRRIGQLVRDGRLPGAAKVGRDLMIPETAVENEEARRGRR